MRGGSPVSSCSPAPPRRPAPPAAFPGRGPAAALARRRRRRAQRAVAQPRDLAGQAARPPGGLRVRRDEHRRRRGPHHQRLRRAARPRRTATTARRGARAGRSSPRSGCGGAPADGPSTRPSLSGTSRVAPRCVAFVSAASNLVRGDTNGTPDAFVRFLDTGVTRRVSVSSQGRQSSGTVSEVAVNGLCTRVAFVSDGGDLALTRTRNRSWRSARTRPSPAGRRQVYVRALRGTTGLDEALEGLTFLASASQRRHARQRRQLRHRAQQQLARAHLRQRRDQPRSRSTPTARPTSTSASWSAATCPGATASARSSW